MKLIVYCAAAIMVAGLVVGCSSEPEIDETPVTPASAPAAPPKGTDQSTGGGGMPKPTAGPPMDDLKGG
jgi:hypothetical protein